MSTVIFNNKEKNVGDDLQENISKNSRLSIAASIFSIYGFEALKKELQNIESLRFIFTESDFIAKNNEKKKEKLFEINTPKIRDTLSGTEFEINLKNELKSGFIARECRKWIEEKARFKTKKEDVYIDNFLVLENENKSSLYSGMDEFSSAGFGFEKDNSIMKIIVKMDDYENVKEFLKKFDEMWNNEKLFQDITTEVMNYISELYKENSPEFIYYIILYNIFDEFLEDINEWELANEKTGFKDSVIWNKMYDFQKDAVREIINKLNRYNGCILADSVGLGKTFTALGVIKYFQEKNQSILVLCPKKLGDNWKTFLENYEDNPLYKDRLNYDVLYHTDLGREKWESNGKDLSRINWWNYDLLVIDESHNFRNNDTHKNKESRYQKLMKNVIKSWVKTKVLMLSATPVNNRFNDLKNQIALAYEWKTDFVDEKMDVSKSINSILANAQKIFNEWNKPENPHKTASELLAQLSRDFDFFKLLDSVTIARSRKHIEKYYNMNDIGKFPTRLPPQSISTEITHLDGFMTMEELYTDLDRLSMSIYSPFDYILSTKRDFYDDVYDTRVGENGKLKQSTRENSLKNLMKTNLLKRLESSVDSFRITFGRFVHNIEKTIQSIENFEKNGWDMVEEFENFNNYEIDWENDDWLDDAFSIGEKVKINLADMNTLGWKRELEADLKIAKDILEEMSWVEPKDDAKLNKLKELIANKIQNPINAGNKKIIIFTAFADTAHYLYKNLAEYNKVLWLHTAKITGSDNNECTLKMVNNQFHTILTNFSPISKNRKKEQENNPQIDILIATDCISEWQNLQDCDMLVNYDIHWNPVRIIQRFGRVDRIGSKNSVIQLVNFWPPISLDDYIKLKWRVEARMHMMDITATGEDNVLTNHSSDLLFRQKQLERLKKEVVDIEEMNSGISIMDLGLGRFRMDLVSYIEKNWWKFPSHSLGMHTVCSAIPEKWIECGVIYILKNRSYTMETDKINHLHPFYIVYIRDDGKVISDYLSVKNTLDILSLVSVWKSEPIREKYQIFNTETHDGKDMSHYSELLAKSIESIISTQDESAIDSLFSAGGTTALENTVSGLSDFELIAFVIIK